MQEDFIYEIARFDVTTEQEVLLERLELVRENGTLAIRRAGGDVQKLSTGDVTAAISETPALSEIRANQVTRIKAGGAALDLLPFSLSVPGDPDDYDESLWSKNLANIHIRQDWVVQPGRLRVAYVNEARWCPWPTAEGPRMLPERWPVVDISPTWARLTFCELGSMTAGIDEFTLGLITPQIAAACYHLDSESLKVAAWRRTGNSSDDARIVVEWLLDGCATSYSTDDGLQALLTQLFVEAKCLGNDGSPVSGGRLAAGWGVSLGFGDTDTSEWQLDLRLPSGVGSHALDFIAERSDRLSAIVTAARDPNSPEAQARRDAVQEWEREWESEQTAALDGLADSCDDDEVSEYEDDEEEYDYEPTEYGFDGPWNHSPLSRMPPVITPGVIPIQFWRVYTRRGKPVGSDFVFNWPGEREVTWRYGISTDKPALESRWYTSFEGTARWPDGVNVELTYSSADLKIEGTKNLGAVAPTIMDPHSNDRMKRPGLWVDLAMAIISFLDALE